MDGWDFFLTVIINNNIDNKRFTLYSLKIKKNCLKMILFNPSLKNLQNKNFTFGKVTNLLNDGVVFGVIFFYYQGRNIRFVISVKSEARTNEKRAIKLWNFFPFFAPIFNIFMWWRPGIEFWVSFVTLLNL